MLGLINNVLLEFLRNRFDEEGLGSILGGAELTDVFFESSCPYADGISYK
jgi:hypothetical protein